MRVGKTRARAGFLRLVEAVAGGREAIEITDRGEVAAVLLGHAEYLRLKARAGEKPAARRKSPVGLLRVRTEDLEQASREIRASIMAEILNSAQEL
ncbi:MAG: hypothetical protein AB1758_29410 [Candidatus Eremiobacterota bacterium]